MRRLNVVPKSRWKTGRKRIGSVFDRVLLYEFDALEEHRSFAETSLKDTIKSLEKRVKEDVAAMDPDEHEAYHDQMYDQYVITNEILPRIQWNSQFLVVYSTFEHMLNQLCRVVQRRSGFDLSFKDLSGQGIERSKNYLSKVAGVKSPFQKPAWQRAKLLGDVRNAIAHNNGEIKMRPDDKSSLGPRLGNEKYLELKKLIPDEKDAQIVLKSEFVRESIIELRNMLVSICNYELYEDES